MAVPMLSADGHAYESTFVPMYVVQCLLLLDTGKMWLEKNDTMNLSVYLCLTSVSFSCKCNAIICTNCKTCSFPVCKN